MGSKNKKKLNQLKEKLRSKKKEKLKQTKEKLRSRKAQMQYCQSVY